MSLGGPHSQDSRNTTLEFEVGRNATAIVAELAWADGASDLDLLLVAPHYCNGPVESFPVCIAKAFVGDPAGTGVWRSDGGLPGQGDSPAGIQVASAEWQAFDCADHTSCTWGASVSAKATAGAAFHLYATVFYGEEPPQGYTAIA